MNLQALTDPRVFRDQLLIDADGASVRLGSVLDPWQRSDFEALDASWMRLAGVSRERAPTRAWLERPRGHSKTSDLATMVCYALFASKRPIRGIVAAADADQARLLKNAIQTLVRLNPWLNHLLKITANRVENTFSGSTLEIISSDVATSWGQLVDFVVCDEVTHWTKRDLMDSTLSTAAKRRKCLFVVITNAGCRDTWQWELREQIRKDKSWIFRRLDGPQASWISADALAEQERLLPSVSYQRLWLNVFVDSAGDAALTADEIERALSSEFEFAPEPGWAYVLGCDLGIRRDASAVVVLGKHVGTYSEREVKPKLSPRERLLCEAGVKKWPTSRWEVVETPATEELKVCHVRTWRPEKGESVSIEDVEQHIAQLHQRYEFESIGCDPWQAIHMIQRLQSEGLPAIEIPFTGGNLASMASQMIQPFREQKIRLVRDEGLLRDLRRMRCVEKSYGARLDFCRDDKGHGDTATALAIAMHAAKDVNTTTQGRVQGELICWP